jgi:hypothetical protein
VHVRSRCALQVLLRDCDRGQNGKNLYDALRRVVLEGVCREFGSRGVVPEMDAEFSGCGWKSIATGEDTLLHRWYHAKDVVSQ